MSKLPTLKIDVVSDIVWPWCYVGKRNLERAIARVPKEKARVDLRFRPFQLVPDSVWGRFPPEARAHGINKLEWYNEKFGAETVKGFEPRLRAAFANAGIAGTYTLDGNVGPTFDGHRLATYAGSLEPSESGALAVKQNDFMEAMFERYFIKSLAPCEKDVILDAARAASLDVDKCAEILSSAEFTLETEDEMRAYARGINGVPHFIISNGSRRLQFGGAQPPEVFIDAFEELLGETLD